MNLFHSARLKLTGFYFAVILVFCVLLTFGVRTFTTHELRRGDAARSSAVHRIFDNLYNTDTDTPNNQDVPPPPSRQVFASTEQAQSDVTRDHLNHDFLFLDIAFLIVGAAVSYWYAGRTLQPIEEAHEQQKRFTADASHELRTPLTSMKLENEVFLRQKRFSEAEARDLIASNLEEVERLERLASNLLALNTYEHATISVQPVQVATAMEDIVTATKRLVAFKTTVFKLDVQPASVRADLESLHELMTILFDNAIKYGPNKGPVEVTGRQQGHHYELTVRDHGAGIADDDLPHIFERMYRGDKARGSKTPGHGIGLSLACQIAEANQAHLTAANHEKGGAVFTLTLTT